MTKPIRAYLDKETREQIAQLRALYAIDEQPCFSLTQVIADAIENYHYNFFKTRAIPGGWRDYMKSEPHTNDHHHHT